MTGKISVQPFCFLTCMLSLAAAVLNPTTLEATNLLGDSLRNNPINSTLAAVIPGDFTIRPSLPLDEPVLNRRISLLLTLQALGDLAFEDFIGQQHSQTWRSLQHVSIDIVGPSKTVQSVLAVRKYALWGIYKAIHLMVASNDFRPRNYNLLWQGTLVGYVGFNNGVLGILGVQGGSANETNTAAQKKNLPVSAITLPENVTTSNLKIDHIQIDYELTGHTIGEDNVFMTLFTAILKAAPYYPTERVGDFLLNTRTFNTYLTFKGRALGPDEPYLEYPNLIRVFTEFPKSVIQHGERWTEASFIVWNVEHDLKVIGAGMMKWVGSTDNFSTL